MTTRSRPRLYGWCEMDIVHLDVRPQPGGYVRILAVVDGKIEDAAKACEIAKQRPCELIIKPKVKKRTLTANAYYQALLDKLASALRMDRRELHRMMLSRYGVTDTFDGVPILISMREDIDPKELGEIYVDPVSTDDGFTTYRVLKGSSRMDTREFAALVDGVVSECKELGIETLPEDEIKRMFEVSQQ